MFKGGTAWVQGTAFFMSGVVLVVWGWAVVGMLVETYGFWLLFAGFVPTALSFLRRVPVFGRLLDLPMFKRVGSHRAARLPCALGRSTLSPLS